MNDENVGIRSKLTEVELRLTGKCEIFSYVWRLARGWERCLCQQPDRTVKSRDIVMNIIQNGIVERGVVPILETGISGGRKMSMAKQIRGGAGSNTDAILQDLRRSAVSYTALVSHAFDPLAFPSTRLNSITSAMRMTEAARDTSDAARLAGQSFVRWLSDPTQRDQFYAAFEGQRSSLPAEERARRLALLADEAAGHGNVKDPDGFAAPNFLTAGEPGGDPAALTELPPGCVAALLAVRRAPSLILLSATLGFSEVINLAAHMHAASIAHHAAYMGLALDPSTVGEKLAKAAGARPIRATWAFVQVRLRSVPTYAIGLQLGGPAAP